MEKVNARAKKVVVIGPESTGKTTLSSLLARYYNTEWVPEYARYYLNRLDRDYEKADLLKIAEGQLAWEDEKLDKVDRLLICDTDLIVLKVWSEHKYGSCADEILRIIKERHYDLYLLTDVDLPWEDDPLRENPNLREYFISIYKNELEQTGVPFILISGEHYQRKKRAVEAIDKLMRQSL